MKSREFAFLILGSLTAAILVSACALCGLGGVLVTQRGGLCLPDSLLAPGALFYDDFCSEKTSREKGWTFTSTEKVDVIWSSHRLTQVIKKRGSTHTSWVGKSFRDFGIEVEAEPASDPHSTFAIYGIAFGIRDEPANDYYHFGVTTADQYFLAKIAGDQVVQPYLVDLTSSTAIQPRPAKNRLGVLVEGSTISLYINGYLVNTVRDDSFQGGSIGVFTSATLTDWNSVGFTRVTVWSAPKAKAEWGARVASEPTVPPSGILFQDDFSSQQASTDKGWSFGTDAQSDFLWSPNKYTIVLKQKDLIQLSMALGEYKDFGIEIEAEPDANLRAYGIVFRADATGKNRYRFGVQAWQGEEWGYYLVKEVDGKSSEPWLVDLRPSPHIKPGAVKNRLGVLADGATISLYINGHRVKTLTDESFSSGEVGLFAHNTNADRAQVSFSRVTIYTTAKAKAEWGAPPALAPGVVYQEDFKSKEDAENNGWEFDSTDKRDNVWSPGKLTLAVKQKRSEVNGPLYYDTFRDCGIEIEAQPEDKPGLSYGIAFGVNSQSGRLSAYSFGITTEGRYYLYRMVEGTMVESDPVFLRPSTYVKPGASLNRLGVLIEGSTIALYINGQPVKTIADAAAIGGAGVFVTNPDNDPAHVDFSRMTIYSLEKAKQEWATPLTATPGILFHDDFSSEQTSEENGWVFSSGDAVDNIWSPNKLTIALKQKDVLYVTYPGGIFSDLGVEIEAQPEGSSDASYGIVFRSNRSQERGEYYLFGVNTRGLYFLLKKVGGKFATPNPIEATPLPYINPGAAQNRLGVLAEGATMSLYVNGHLVQTITDDSIASGSVGVFVMNDEEQVQVVFSRLTVYTVEKARTELGKR